MKPNSGVSLAHLSTLLAVVSSVNDARTLFGDAMDVHILSSIVTFCISYLGVLSFSHGATVGPSHDLVPDMSSRMC